MTIEIAIIIFLITIGIAFLCGFIAVGRGDGTYLNAYEKLYKTYKDSKFKLKELDYKMLQEDTKQLELETKQLELRIQASRESLKPISE